MASKIQDRSAIIYKLEDKIKLFDLVCKGASEQQWADWLRPPLEHAAASGELELVKTLVRAGAKVEAEWKGCQGRTLLHAAAQSGKHETVSALLKAGVKPGVNLTHGSKKWTALHYAAYGGHETMVKVLMFAGADVSCTDVSEATPLHLAACGGRRQVVFDLALGGADVNKLNRMHLSPLMLTVIYGHASTTEALLTAGADAGLRCGVKNRTALAEAASRGEADVMKALIQHGVDFNAGNPNEHGATALHLAAYFNHGYAVHVLIVESGAHIEARSTNRSNTALSWAAQQNSCDALRTLLQHKANIDAESATGTRPLAAACANMAEGAAKLLLRWGADETCVDNRGRSASDMVGTALLSSERHGRKQGIERLQRLLARAPMDRAWRRRGILVLCRAFRDKVRLRVDSDQAVGGGEPPAAIGNRGTKFPRTVKVEVREAPADLAAEMGTASDDVGGEAGRDVEAKVVELEQEALFRKIVCFL